MDNREDPAAGRDEEGTEAREFPLASILTVTTGRFLCPDVGDLYEILDYLTSTKLLTHQLPAAAEAVRSGVIEQHPQLADVAVPPEVADQAWVAPWLAGQRERYGQSLPLRSVPAVRLPDPIADLIARLSPADPLPASTSQGPGPAGGAR